MAAIPAEHPSGWSELLDLEQNVNRQWFPVPTGGDDAPELISRLNSGETDIPLRNLTYSWQQALGVLPANSHLQGAGKRLTVINKNFNGDIGSLADGAQLSDLTINGNGATRTGKCFTISGTNGRQSMRQVRIYDMEDIILDFATAAGSQSEFFGCTFARFNAIGTDRYSVRIDPAQQLSAVPRKFIGCETDGTDFIDMGGCNDLFVSGGGYLGRLLFSTQSRGVLLNGVRLGALYNNNSPSGTCDTNNTTTITNVTPTTGWINGMVVSGTGIPLDTRIISGAGTATMVLSNATTGGALTGITLNSSVLYMRGANNAITGCDVAPQIVIDTGASACTAQGNTHNASPTLDISGFPHLNLVDSRRATYGPDWLSSGVAPALGNGSIIGDWSRQGSTVHFSAQLTIGSTSTFGTGFYRISLPMAPAAGINQNVECLIYDSSANFYYTGIGVIGTGLTYVSMQTSGASGVAATSPITFATGDLIRVSGSYQL